VFPSDGALPPTSFLNFTAGETRGSFVIVPPGADRKIKIYNAAAGPVQVRGDIVGSFGPGGPITTGLSFKPLDPTRVLDTRGGPPVASGTSRTLQIRGFGSIPNSANVQAVVINLAAVTPSGTGTVGADQPLASPGAIPSWAYYSNSENSAGLAIVRVGVDGTIKVWNNGSGTTQIIADITGYFTS
jgi:hypothetical protein